MNLPAVTVHCPYCGEPMELLVDAIGSPQDYIEDCPVCCRPVEVHVDAHEGEGSGEGNATPGVRVNAENGM